MTSAIEPLPVLFHGGHWIAVFTTRQGGVSDAPYSTLNSGHHVDDKPAAVVENRRRIGHAIGADASGWVSAEQVHGDRIALVTDRDSGSTVREADGLITRTGGLILCLTFADCLPVVAYDPLTNAVGIAHAGWRGAAADVAGRLVASMAREFGTQPSAVEAALGPCIGQCCYEVGPEVVAAFEKFPAAVHQENGSWRLDLTHAVRSQLDRAGVQRIATQNRCTACDADNFFSYRRDRVTGRMALLARLPLD